jgi:hypothetical protein
MKPSLSAPDVRIDVWRLRAMSIAVEAFARRCTG